jgi:hypothetical protein
MNAHPHAVTQADVSDDAGAGARRAPLSARRLLVLGGIGLILCGMILGDAFAAFVLHPNADRIGASLLAATRAVAAGDPQTAGAAFQSIGGYQENRGTKVDAHSHMIGFGYIALLLALLQPVISFSASTKKSLAKLFLLGAVLLPVGVFLIHYVGLSASPFAAIGWASVFADLGGLFVIVACVGELAGLWKHVRGHADNFQGESDELLGDRSWAGRALLSGGTILVLLGFLHGTYYAAFDLYRNEAKDAVLFSAITTRAAVGDAAFAAQAVAEYGGLQAAKAVNIAAHAHVIEFGVLAILLAFFQPYIFLSERWRRIWVVALLLGSLTLPLFVLMELRWGLLAGGIADLGGLLVIVALFAMFVGVLRYTGKLDAADGAA